MLRWLRDAITPSKGKSLARSLSRLGWFGFWLQVIFGSLPIVVLVYYYIFSRPTASPSQGFGFTEYLTIINLFLLAFTTYWSYRYTPHRKPPARPGPQTLRGLRHWRRMDGRCGHDGGHAFLHDCRPIGHRKAAVLLPEGAAGRHPGDPNLQRRSNPLGFVRRHDRPDGASPVPLRGTDRPAVQPLAAFPSQPRSSRGLAISAEIGQPLITTPADARHCTAGSVAAAEGGPRRVAILSC